MYGRNVKFGILASKLDKKSWRYIKSNILAQKKEPAREDLNRCNICHKIFGTSFLPKKKAPASAGKTSTELIHVIKSQERPFCRKKGACGSREDLNRANICHKIFGTSFLPNKKDACGSREDLTKASTHHINLRKVILCCKKTLVAARKTSPSLTKSQS